MTPEQIEQGESLYGFLYTTFMGAQEGIPVLADALARTLVETAWLCPEKSAHEHLEEAVQLLRARWEEVFDSSIKNNKAKAKVG
jgi:hypothetical protein